METLKALERIGNCQTQVELPIFKFKRKEYKIVEEGLIKEKKLREIIASCIELLSQHGINSKQTVRKILEEAIK